MSDKFDRDLSAIVGARKSKQEEAAQKQAQLGADAAKFTNDWLQLRTSLVDPTLQDVRTALSKQDLASEIAAHAGQGVALRVRLQDAQLSRNPGLGGQPSLTFEPRPFTQTVKVGYADHSKEVKLDEINREFIEEAAIALVRKFLSSET